MIKEVSYPIAKLLKEKDFPQLNQGLYYTKDKNHCLVGWGFNDRTDDSFAQYSAPTIAEVVMWLYETHDIWIMIDMTGSKKFYPRGRMIDKKGKHHVGDFKYNSERLIYNSPIEAYEAGINYCLTNLI